MKDDELATHYEDPANRRLIGKPRRRSSLSIHAIAGDVKDEGD